MGPLAEVLHGRALWTRVREKPGGVWGKDDILRDLFLVILESQSSLVTLGNYFQSSEDLVDLVISSLQKVSLSVLNVKAKVLCLELLNWIKSGEKFTLFLVIAYNFRCVFSCLGFIHSHKICPCGCLLLDGPKTVIIPQLFYCSSFHYAVYFLLRSTL